MSRLLWVAFMTIAAIGSLAALSLAASSPGRATAAAPPPAPNLPAVSCDFTVLNFNLGGTGSIGATRPISITAGDTFEQFIATPITATSDSLAYAIVNNNFSGGVSGGVVGTFALANLNGLLVTSPEGSLTTPRGFELNDIVIHGATGTITAVMAINILALSSTPPYFPRGFNGYLHSTSTSGSYAPYKYNGAVAGTIFSTGGLLSINAAVIGRLYTGGGSLSETVFAARTLPPNRTTTFDTADIIAQFHIPDFTVGTAAPGHITSRNNMIGTSVGTIKGGFIMDHEALIVDGGANAGKGWFGGEFTFSDSGGDLLTGPWLADLSNNSMSGYVWQVVGTGVYSDSLLFGTVNGSFLPGGTIFSGNMSGVYCEGSQIPTSTPTTTVSPTATETGQPIPTNTDTPTATATFIPTSTPTNTTVAATATDTATNTPTITDTPTSTDTPTDIPTNTPTHTPTDTPTSTPTDTETPTFTPTHTNTPTDTTTSTSTPTFTNTSTNTPTDTPTDTPTHTPTHTPTNAPTETPVLCPINFTDVPATAYFYDAVRNLYCRGVVSGYGDNTFHPYNNTTRSQLCKIVVLAEGWDTVISGVPHFNDVSTQDPFYAFIETAYYKGLINGYNDGTFHPENEVSRAQLCKIIVLAQQWSTNTSGGPHFSDVLPDNAFYGFVETAYSKRIINGYDDGTFRPTNSATRGQICKIVYQAINAP